MSDDTPSLEPAPADPSRLAGRERWEVVHVEGPPHGGLWELEIDHTFHVVDRRTGNRVLSFEGEYSAHLGGSCEWVDGQYDGVRDVQIDDEGRFALVYRRGEEPERVPLPD